MKNRAYQFGNSREEHRRQRHYPNWISEKNNCNHSNRFQFRNSPESSHYQFFGWRISQKFDFKSRSNNCRQFAQSRGGW